MWKNDYRTSPEANGSSIQKMSIAKALKREGRFGEAQPRKPLSHHPQLKMKKAHASGFGQHILFLCLIYYLAHEILHKD